MVLKKIIDRPKGVVGLHEIPSSKTILVCADGIVKGLVAKVYQATPCKYKCRIQWVNGHFTDLMALSDLVSRYQADGYTFMVEIMPGEPLRKIAPTEPAPPPDIVFIDDVNPHDKIIVVAKTYMGLVVGEKIAWNDGVKSPKYESFTMLYNQQKHNNFATFYLVSDGEEQ